MRRVALSHCEEGHLGIELLRRVWRRQAECDEDGFACLLDLYHAADLLDAATHSLNTFLAATLGQQSFVHDQALIALDDTARSFLADADAGRPSPGSRPHVERNILRDSFLVCRRRRERLLSLILHVFDSRSGQSRTSPLLYSPKASGFLGALILGL